MTEHNNNKMTEHYNNSQHSFNEGEIFDEEEIIGAFSFIENPITVIERMKLYPVFFREELREILGIKYSIYYDVWFSSLLRNGVFCRLKSGYYTIGSNFNRMETLIRAVTQDNETTLKENDVFDEEEIAKIFTLVKNPLVAIERMKQFHAFSKKQLREVVDIAGFDFDLWFTVLLRNGVFRRISNGYFVKTQNFERMETFFKEKA